jgi:hypothetical protein
MAMDIPSISSGAFTIGYQIFLAITVIVSIAILFFGVRLGMGAWKNYKTYKITATIVNRDGTFYTAKIGKFKTSDNIDKMKFRGSRETMPVIDPVNIRNNKVMLWRYGIGQYAVISPKTWDKLNPRDFKIEILDYQAKNFAYLEQRAAVTRWAYMKDQMAKFAPFIVMLILVIATGVICWFLMKLGYNIYGDAVAARIQDCKAALGTQVAPSV